MADGPFICEQCGRGCRKLIFKNEHTDRLFKPGTYSMCPTCHVSAQPVTGQAPALKRSTMDTYFKPHYDGQLGEFFQDADSKKKYLRDNNLATAGPLSPRNMEGNPHCTSSQVENAKKKGLL